MICLTSLDHSSYIATVLDYAYGKKLQVLYENLQVFDAMGFRIPVWTNQIAVFVTTMI